MSAGQQLKYAYSAAFDKEAHMDYSETLMTIKGC